MKKLIIGGLIVLCGISTVVVVCRVRKYTSKDTNRIINILLEKNKANLVDYIRLDMNHDFKITLYDLVLIQEKIIEEEK